MQIDQSLWVEDLRLQAVRGLAAGRALCSCAGGYHVLWGALRAAGCKPQLQPEEAVLLPLLSGLISDGTQLLIAGAADAGLLSMIGRSLRQHSPQVTVLDHCPAPLRVIDEFAHERKLPCNTLLADLVELDVQNRWDVALLHYTLLFIEPFQRGNVLHRLARALRPRGTLICVIQTYPAERSASDMKSPSSVAEEYRERINRAELDLPLHAAEMDERIRNYVSASLTRKGSVPNIEEVKQHLSDAGVFLEAELYGPVSAAAQFGKGDIQRQKGNAVLTAIRSR
jgi:hypothetical protein